MSKKPFENSTPKTASNIGKTPLLVPNAPSFDTFFKFSGRADRSKKLAGSENISSHDRSRTLEEERTERITRLAGLERVAIVRERNSEIKGSTVGRADQLHDLLQSKLSGLARLDVATYKRHTIEDISESFESSSVHSDVSSANHSLLNDRAGTFDHSYQKSQFAHRPNGSASCVSTFSARRKLEYSLDVRIHVQRNELFLNVAVSIFIVSL